MLSNEEMEKIIYDCELSIQQDKNQEAIIMGDYLNIIKGYNPYHHSSIYIIKSENTNKVYIGSTTLTLKKRLKKHLEMLKYCEKYRTKKRYLTSFEILKYGNYYIELIENVCCENETELYKIEGSWQRKTPNLINKNTAGRTAKEWYEDNKEERSKKSKIYREENREKILEYDRNRPNKKERNDKKKEMHTCFCGGKYSNRNKARHNKSSKHLQHVQAN